MMTDIFQNYCSHGNNEYPKVARFLTIYIEEAHARDEWWLPDSAGGKACIYNHKTLQDRLQAGKKFVEDFSFKPELICDSFKNQVDERFEAWPERLYIVQNGVIVYQGGYGPFDYKLAEVKDWLIERYGLRGEVITRR